jgi:hypothetical protein
LSRFSWRALLLLWQLRIFAAAAARPDPTQGPEPHAPFQNTQNRWYFEKGCEVRDLDGVVINC